MRSFVKQLISLKRSYKIFTLILLDSLSIFFSFLISIYLRINNFDYLFEFDTWVGLLIILLITIALLYKTGIYFNIIRFFSNESLVKLTLVTIGSGLTLLIIIFTLKLNIPRSVPFIYMLLILIIFSYLRFFLKSIVFNILQKQKENIAIVGTTSKSIKILDLLRSSQKYETKLFIDLTEKLIGKKISNFNIYSIKNFDEVFKKYNIKLVFLPSSTSTKTVKLIVDTIESYPIKIRFIPDPDHIINKPSILENLSSISIENYLKRELITPHTKLIKRNIKSKVILVTGAGGSIGSQICKQILKFNPKKVILYDNSEYALYKINNAMKQALNDETKSIKIISILGSITDKKIIKNCITKNKVDTIFHTAAFKHVSLVENNFSQAIYNNIYGTELLCKLAVKLKVKSFTLISTDKAVRPTSLMGVTKRVSELICQSLALANNSTKISIVRFGNVIESSGSVIPLFKKQISMGGPVTITNKNVTRFFMTKKEAAELVIQASSIGKSGEILFLDMGKAINILELAKKMIFLYGLNFVEENKDHSKNSITTIKIKFIGLQPGEKLHEELSLNKNYNKTIHPRIFSVNEDKASAKELKKILTLLYSYKNSDSPEKLKRHLSEQPIYFQ